MSTKYALDDYTENKLMPVIEKLANGLEFFASAILTSGRSRRVSSSEKMNPVHNVKVLCKPASARDNGIALLQQKVIESYCVRPEDEKPKDRLHAISIKDQQVACLQSWVSHLHSLEDDVDYPDHFIEFVLETIVDSTQRNFNGVEEIRFRKRNSLEKFPELNTYALNSVYDAYVSSTNDKVLCFGNMYADALTEVYSLLEN